MNTLLVMALLLGPTSQVVNSQLTTDYSLVSERCDTTGDTKVLIQRIDRLTTVTESLVDKTQSAPGLHLQTHNSENSVYMYLHLNHVHFSN